MSTRDPNGAQAGYETTVLKGLANHGGLYVPNKIPNLGEADIQALLKLEYSEMAARIKGIFACGDIPDSELNRIAHEAYDITKFPDQEDGIVTRTRRIGRTCINIQDLSDGPTAAFKDVAMQFIAREVQYLLEKNNAYLDIIGATSGDTGSAAEAALRGLDRVRIAMLSPLNGMSKFQRRQMGELTGDGVTNISVRGNFDNCQDLVKQIMQSDEFAHLGAVNSINWARIVAQIPYYFSGYHQAAVNYGDPVDFVVPSGNFGNALAGYYARAMGLPIRNIVLATNENNVLDTFVKSGVYAETDAQITSSPSMDISKASNLERLLYYIFSQDPELTSKFMTSFASTSIACLEEFGASSKAMERHGFRSGVSTHENRIATMRWAFEHGAGVIDPHTADAVTVARSLPEDGVPKVCLETAKAVKFLDTVADAQLQIPGDQAKRFADVISNSGEGEGFIIVNNDPGEVVAVLRGVLA